MTGQQLLAISCFSLLLIFWMFKFPIATLLGLSCPHAVYLNISVFW